MKPNNTSGDDTTHAALLLLVKRSMGDLRDGRVLPVELLVEGLLWVQIVLIEQKVEGV